MPAGTLAAAAGAVPGVLGDRLRALDTAMGAPDPVAAVLSVMATLPNADSAALAAVLSDVGAAMVAGMDGFGEAVAAAVPSDQLAQLAEDQARLADIGATI